MVDLPAQQTLNPIDKDPLAKGKKNAEKPGIELEGRDRFRMKRPKTQGFGEGERNSRVTESGFGGIVNWKPGLQEITF